MNEILGECYEDAVVGQPPKPTRLMAGLLYFKHTYALAAEELVERWVENACWQFFCGETFFQNGPPIHPRSQTRYRNRIGPERCQELLRLSLVAGEAEKVIQKRDLTEVIEDTTVMEMGITYQKDSNLYLASLLRLNMVARKEGADLRQSYARTAKRLAGQAGRYAHARLYKCMCRVLKQLRVRLGRVVQDIERKTAQFGCRAGDDRARTGIGLASVAAGPSQP